MYIFASCSSTNPLPEFRASFGEQKTVSWVVPLICICIRLTDKEGHLIFDASGFLQRQTLTTETYSVPLCAYVPIFWAQSKETIFFS